MMTMAMLVLWQKKWKNKRSSREEKERERNDSSACGGATIYEMEIYTWSRSCSKEYHNPISALSAYSIANSDHYSACMQSFTYLLAVKETGLQENIYILLIKLAISIYIYIYANDEDTSCNMCICFMHNGRLLCRSLRTPLKRTKRKISEIVCKMFLFDNFVVYTFIARNENTHSYAYVEYYTKTNVYVENIYKQLLETDFDLPNNISCCTCIRF